MRCPSCGVKVKRSQARCPSCGSPLVPMPPMFGGAAREVRPSLGYPAQAVPEALPERRLGGRVVLVVIVALALVALSLAALVLVRGIEAPGRGVPLSASVFPDAALRAVVKTYDADDDDALNADELAALTTLDCSNRSISSLQGLASLTSLTSLNASGNDLAEADLSSNPALGDVDLSDNHLSSVNLANLSALTSLDVSGNSLTSLDLGACPRLMTLSCGGNQLARLDLSKNPQATDISYDGGLSLTIPIAEGFFPDAGLRASLASVDSDGDGALSERERTAVTTLKVSDTATADLSGLAWLPSLVTLDISGTAVASLDCAQLPPLLNSLIARDSALGELSLAGLEWLYVLDVANTPLSALDLSATTRLTSLDVTGTQLGTLDVTPCASTLSTLHVGEGVAVTGAVTRTSAAFPDAAVRSAVFSTKGNPDGDDMLTGAELAALTTLDLSGTGATNLAGLSSLGALRSLNCSGLKLGTFSAQGLGQLQELNLAGCSLTSVDLSAATSLTRLDVSNNDLEALSVGTSPNLAQLSATGNPRLTQVEVSGTAQLVPGENALVDEGCEIIQTQ